MKSLPLTISCNVRLFVCVYDLSNILSACFRLLNSLNTNKIPSIGEESFCQIHGDKTQAVLHKNTKVQTDARVAI